MSTIAEAIALIGAERDARETERLAKQTEIMALTKRIEGLEIAIAALRDIDAQPTPARQPETPIADNVTMASIAAKIGGTDEAAAPTAADVGAEHLGIAETLAAEMLADLPQLMADYPGGPTVRDLAVHYGTNDPRARDACKRLRDSGRALFQIDPERNMLCLRPRTEKVAA